MNRDGSLLKLSATDLAGFLGCGHLTELERMVAEGRAEYPAWRDPMLAVLQERGLVHEEAYLSHLRKHRGLEVLAIDGVAASNEAFDKTKAAMRKGVDAIAQAAFIDGRWHGRADVLLRTDRPSKLGSWSYEVVDTKLASETRGSTVLQICLYSDLLSKVQGLLPEQMYVVTPLRYDEPECYRAEDFLAYYRLLRMQLEEAVSGPCPDDPTSYPEPVPHCDVCRWWSQCDVRRHEDDHLSLVAGLTRLQQRELQAGEINTVERLASASLPLDPHPARGSSESYERAHHQARIQVASRAEPMPLFEPLFPVEAGQGLARLPEPCAGDVFLDLEGDPFVEGGGREYLFGWALLDDSGDPQYRRIWALDSESEQKAFEALIDELTESWDRYPDLHIYHFAPYEPAALKRLMGRYATREEPLDRLLRGNRFVDLYAVVRQGIRVGVERYTLKHLEDVHAFTRSLDLRDASAQLRCVERALELADVYAISDEVRAAVEIYNREDCFSTLSLRNWLEKVREGVTADGTAVPRPEPGDGDPPEELNERQQRILALFERLTLDVPLDPRDRNREQDARWLLAHLLDWHRREAKATWWEYFRLQGLSDEDLLEEKPGLSGMTFVGSFGGTAACPIHRYQYPQQDHDIRARQTLHLPDGDGFGNVVALDPGASTIDVKKRKATRDVHPSAVFAHDFVSPGPLPDALERLANWVSVHGVDALGPTRAARDLLLKAPPRLPLSSASDLVQEGEELLAAGRRLALELDHGVLPIQGPPGAGKTYMGARMICELVRSGKKVGVTAVSHKVIQNLLNEVLAAAGEEGLDVQCVHKVSNKSESPTPGVTETTTNPGLLDALVQDRAQVGAGTVWAWARQDFEDAVDVLIVDEAGQMSLANTVAAAGAAQSLILLGDPQQLEQPIQGSHPEGADASALEHLLAGHETIPDDRGLFLSETWRLHPAICEYTSEIFYEGRLRPRDGRDQQRLLGPTPFAGSGLWLSAVEHDGNQSSSPEEVERVVTIASSLIQDGVAWINSEGVQSELSIDDILIVAPYNAQVNMLSERLPSYRIGTVDKFQGQEAPVVIYSMTTSSAEDAPRGMEFLYSLHRLNVASSRARCVCILVASPRLLEPECRTPHHMRLANALCRYAELADRMPGVS